VKVFVTGGSGFIGSAVISELMSAGHSVVALARSERSAATLEARGAEVLRGDLEDLDALREGAAAADGVAHLGFIHDFSNFAHAVEVDFHAVQTLAEALEGSKRPLVIAAGTLGVAAPGRVARERDPAPAGFGRGRTEDAALGFAERGVRSVAVRLPPSVHGAGDHGFVQRLVDIARTKGVSGYVGDGTSRWPAVHRKDAARLFRLALEAAPPGTRLHAIQDEGVPTRQIAEVIAKHLSVPTASISADDAPEHFGFLGPLFGLDAPASAEDTRRLMSWTASEPGLIADLDSGHYFAEETRSGLR